MEDVLGIAERRKREKEKRKNDIIDAAEHIFFSKGMNNATMDDVAEAAELSKGSLYLHFPSKEELYVSILVEGLDLLQKRFEKAVEDQKGWEDKLRQIGRAYLSFYEENRKYFQILFFLQHSEIASNVSDTLYQICFAKGLCCLGQCKTAAAHLLVQRIGRRRQLERELNGLGV